MKLKRAVSALGILSLVLNLVFTFPAYADEYVVSGNGEGSSNNINYQQNNSGDIHQSNTAETENNTSAQADTGENTASGNTGEQTAIATGDASSETAIHNSGNTSSATIDCCPSESSSVEVTGNGSDSQNAVNLTASSNTSINTTNNLNLSNNVSINANTGDNEANDNNGDVTIETGEVNILAAILNKDLNSAYVSASKSNPSFNIKVSGNGTGSQNIVTENISEEEEFNIFNDLILNNSFSNSSNTGGNKANGNSGKVFISTGNVYLDFILLNKVNTSKLIAECCKEKPNPTPTPTPTNSPTPTPNPSTPPGGSCCSEPDKPGPPGGGGGGSGGSSSGGGEVLGATLPATGGFSLWQATLFALLMLISGVLLRSDYGKIKTTFKNQTTAMAFLAFLGQSQKNPWKYANRSFLTPTSFNLPTNSQSLFTL